MSNSIHNALVKILAILLGLWGLVQLVHGLDSAAWYGKIGSVVWGIVVIVTAVGFFRMRGWAFLLVSVGLLGSFFSNLVGFILAIDRGEGAKEGAFWFVATIVLIGYLGRWNMERRFRPENRL